MAKQLFGNNASSLIAASISDSDLTIQVQNGFGALFPNPGADEYFLITLENDSGDIEVVKVTTSAVDLFTVPVGGRGQEGTSAQAWTNGQARVELRLTRGTMEVFVQRDGDEMTGDLNMNENEVQDAKLTGTGTQILAGEIVDVPLRGNAGDDSNEVRVPTDGTRATAGGARILVDGDEDEIINGAFVVGQIIMWFGAAGAIPNGWRMCNGTNGTPDLRNRFVIGAGDTYDQNSTGGSTAAFDTANAGAHDHGAATGDHTLTIAEMPSHDHSLSARNFVDELDFGGGATYLLDGGSRTTSATGGDQPHNHPITGAADHKHSVTPPLPPFRGLYFIMFVGIT